MAPLTTGEGHLDWTLEVVVLPVSDIGRSTAFYRDQVGFELDHETKTEQMQVVQFTPRGSGCSIVFGDLHDKESEGGKLKQDPRDYKRLNELNTQPRTT